MTKFYLPLLAFVVLVGCKSASKAYNNGDYADAIELGVKKLQKDPSDYETRDLVKSAYEYAHGQRQESIRTLLESNNDNRFETVLWEYSQLQDLYNTLQQSPGLASHVKPVNYSSYVQTYREKTADVYLERAEKWMAESSKPAFRNAYNDYCRALRFRDNMAIRTKRDEAYNAALTKVLVLPIQNYGGYSYASNYQLQQFQNDVMRTLDWNRSDDFVRFFSEWDLRNRNVEPDQVLEMQLGRILMGRPYDERNVRESSKQVVVKEVVHKPDSITKEYATVRAQIASTKRILLSEGELYLTLRDTRGRTLWTDRFTGQHRWQTEFATYTGDERALTDNDRSLLNRNQNVILPREEEIMSELYRQIQSDLSNRLRGYFARF